MDYEKAYKEALKRAKGFKTDEYKDVAEYIFPELAESEDERTRKAIIKHFEKERKESRKVNYYGVDVFDMLAWLEKQGEHKKFRDSIQVGDKVTRNQDGMLVNLSQLKRIAKPNETKQGEQNSDWSEEDKEKLNRIYMLLPQCIDCHPRIIGDRECVELQDWLKSIKDRVQPQKEWSEEDESLRLRTIGALETCKIGSPTKCVDEQINWLKSLKNRVQLQKQEWSKLDNRIEDCIGMCLTDISEKRFDDFKTSLKECLDWLHSLKDRIWYQPTQEWSEEDKRLLGNILFDLETLRKSAGIEKDASLYQDEINWLKSLRPQLQWKPSDEQMNALKHVSNDCCIAFADTEILATLYEQLKALHRYEQDT